MIIGIDARVLLSGTGGVFSYAKNIIQEIIKISRNHKIKLFANKRAKNFPGDLFLRELVKNSNVELYKFGIPNPVLNVSFKFFDFPYIDKLIKGCDVFFAPTMLYGAFSKKTKIVATMHDLSFEIFPECFTKKQNLWHKLVDPKKICQKAEKVIAVSESTRRDLINFYGLSESSVKTVHSGIEKKFRPIHDSIALNYARKKYSLPNNPIILQTGTIEPRKNGISTILAFDLWNEKNPNQAKDFHLVFAGHRGWKSKDFYRSRSISKYSKKIHIIHEVESADLPAVYNLASVFVYPSLYEGFGFPPIEAMASGIPVIASANSSISEIVGSSGVLIDPYRIETIAESFSAILFNPEFSKSLRKAGLAHTIDFNWERSAKETLKIIESV
jgi:glycosyltransferase involved in cell wall biosynthesis